MSSLARIKAYRRPFPHYLEHTEKVTDIFQEAQFQGAKLQKAIKLVQLAFKRYTGKEFSVGGSGKIRKERGGIVYRVNLWSELARLGFNFDNPANAELQSIDIFLKGQTPINIVIGPTDAIVPKIKEIIAILKRGPAAAVAAAKAGVLTVTKSGKEIDILTDAEKKFQDSFGKLLITEQDLKGRIKLLKMKTAGLVNSGPGAIGKRALVVTGTAGVGKTWSVQRMLEDDYSLFPIGPDQQSSGNDYVYTTGKITNAMLYMILYDHPDGICVFDEADSILTNGECINTLKGALQTNGTGFTSYSTRQKLTNPSDPRRKYEQSFDFYGKIILISNLEISDLSGVDALQDRSNHVHFDITEDGIIEYAHELLSVIYEHIPMEAKKEAFDFFVQAGKFLPSAKRRGGRLSMRTFMDVVLMRYENPQNWLELCLNTG